MFSRVNRINQNPSFIPRWSDKPLLKSYQKTKPPLGWPRETDSLCPTCVREARQAILDGTRPLETLLNEKVGEIKATILEKDGKIVMVKDCPVHGHFEDTMAIDTAFFKHLEEVFPGRDIRAHNDEKLHNHGSSTVKYGRGSVLTVDLTNRCNMMCDPCFMDANQVGFVHELTWEDIKTVLDNAITIKPRRQMSVQFSGGEPTLSPYFLDAVRYARKVGYNSVQAATNGIEFAKSVDFAKAAAEAGLRYAYLQFDGIGNAANSHRRVGNLFDVKLRAIENLHAAGVDIVPVITIVNGVNNEQVGRVDRVRARQSEEDQLPVVPAGVVHGPRRGSDARAARGAALHAVASRARREEPDRPRRADSRLVPDLVHVHVHRLGGRRARARPRMGPADLRLPSELRHRHGRDDRQGNQGSGAGDGVPQGRSARQGRRAGQRRGARQVGVDRRHDAGAAAQLRSVPGADALQDCRPAEEVRQDLRRDRQELRQGRGRPDDDATSRSGASDRWNFLFIAGMWFQDLFNYDFRRTEMCIIPYATQQGEISFCAYNTGIGWRNIIEKMHMTATLTKWYDEHGRHEIFAGNKTVPLNTTEHSLKLNAEAVAAGAQTDLDKLGIAKNAREEQLKARKAAKELTPEEKRHHAEMEKLYRQHVLKEEADAGDSDSGARQQEEAGGRAGRAAQAGRLIGTVGQATSGAGR